MLVVINEDDISSSNFSLVLTSMVVVSVVVLFLKGHTLVGLLSCGKVDISIEPSLWATTDIGAVHIFEEPITSAPSSK